MTGIISILLIFFHQWELSWGGRNTTSHLLPDLIAALPPTDLACKLIDLFFAYVNIQIPLLHRPTFERQWQEGLQFRDPWFSCLCLSVFAVSSRWCDDVRVLSGDDTNESVGDVSEQRNWRHAGYKYFQACLREFYVIRLSSGYIMQDTYDISRSYTGGSLERGYSSLSF